jgi:hypothetical protein
MLNNIYRPLSDSCLGSSQQLQNAQASSQYGYYEYMRSVAAMQNAAAYIPIGSLPPNLPTTDSKLLLLCEDV